MIDGLFSKGKSFVVYPFRVVYLSVSKENEGNSPVSVLMSVSKKKFKSAVKRNRIKRLMKEAYRINKHIVYQTLTHPEKRIIVAFIYLDNEIKDYSFTERKMIETLNCLSKRLEQ